MKYTKPPFAFEQQADLLISIIISIAKQNFKEEIYEWTNYRVL